MEAEGRKVVSLLDYGAGNVRSIQNAIERAGFTVQTISSPHDIDTAKVLVFPGVGNFACTVKFLDERKFREPLVRYINSGRPYFGICLGMQTLFEGSEEDEGSPGLGIIPGKVCKFPSSVDYKVPHIGWNGVHVHNASTAALQSFPEGGKVYFVHSYRALPSEANAEWVCTTTDYGNDRFISSVSRGNVFATQFHPEKSGDIGLSIFKDFLSAALNGDVGSDVSGPTFSSIMEKEGKTTLAKRIVACLDVRTNDDGDLVVTKGDKYDVREKDDAHEKGGVRNLGKPVELAARYYDEGADEVAFLNITAFRSEPLEDAPMLAVLQESSRRVFVPLTIGGGIRAYTDATGKAYSALDVAAEYFRAGADKISIGSDAVYAAEEYYRRDKVLDGSSAIEQISKIYGRQAVVVSIDPRRVYVADPSDPAVVAAGHTVIPTTRVGPGGEAYCWYECTVRGGREGRPLCAHRLAQAVEALGAGELLVNCVDQDGQKAGYDEELLASVHAVVSIPVIASSGAGRVEHFESVFKHTGVEAALAAGIFHRKEVEIRDVKAHLAANGLEQRLV